MGSQFTKLLLRWYSHNARVLPWRGASDPYAVWVSEIMLQQTRVETVIPYFQKWMRRFPTLQALAVSNEQEVLKVWEGLGYYGRARNLLMAARIVLQDHAGILPGETRQLRELPGIGSYIAAAIASIAFGKGVAALDANGERVLARFYAVSQPVNTPAGKKVLSGLAGSLIPPGRAGDFNQALMDLGSLVCTPQRPRCETCPLAAACQAFMHGLQASLPMKTKKASVPHYQVAAAVILRDGRYLITRRPSNGLLGGMWEFPGGKLEPGEDLPACLKREIMEELGTRIRVGEELGVFEHAYTHFSVTVHAFYCRLTGRKPQPLQVSDLRWVKAAEMHDFPMGKVDRLISRVIETNVVK